MLKNRKIFLWPLGYILIMALAMFTSYHIFGWSYADPEMVKVLVFFEAFMTLYAVAVYKLLTPGTVFGRLKVTPSFAIYSGMMLLLFIRFVFLSSHEDLNFLFAVTLLMNLFVGVSEELIFRGVLLQSLLKQVTPLRAVLISAVAFSLLHSVNVLAGFAVSDMTFQLINTFIYGVFAGCLVVRIGNLLPIMFFHFLWDTMVGDTAFVIACPESVFVMVALEIILTIALVVSFKREEK